MRKLIRLALLAAVVAVVAAASAAARPPGTNGLISFTRFDPALHQDVVYTINPDGSGERPLLVGAESGHWSPDGSRILIGPDCCAERILNPDNGNYTELPTFYPNLGLFLGCNIWSPDSARLACEGFGDQPSTDGVYTVRSTDGGNVRRVTSGADDDYPGDYSPNGKRLVFLRSSFDLGPLALYTVKLDGPTCGSSRLRGWGRCSTSPVAVGRRRGTRSSSQQSRPRTSEARSSSSTQTAAA